MEEVESLPRHATMAHLEKVSPFSCVAYLEHIIHTLGEEGSEFHEKLIDLYLATIQSPVKSVDTLNSDSGQYSLVGMVCQLTS